MGLLKRFLIIICTLAISSFASDQVGLGVSNDKRYLTVSPKYNSALQLYQSGCGNLLGHELDDPSLCAASFERLLEIVKQDPDLFKANYILAEFYYSQPPQLVGLLKIDIKKKLLTDGLKHARKAVDLNPSSQTAKRLLVLYYDKLEGKDFVRFPAEKKTGLSN